MVEKGWLVILSLIVSSLIRVVVLTVFPNLKQERMLLAALERAGSRGALPATKGKVPWTCRPRDG